MVDNFFRFEFVARGRLGLSGIAEIGERKIGLLASHGVCIDAKCVRWISVPS